MYRWITLLLFGASLSAAAGCRTYGVDRDFDLTAPWGDYERVVVRSPRGSVEVRAADVSEIRISGTSHAGGFTRSQAEDRLEHVDIVAAADPGDPAVFVVEVTHPWWLPSRWVGGDFEIEVPAPCAADIRTRDGAITVSGLKDEALLKTSNAEVAVDGVVGEVRARTSNGAVTAKNVTGDLVAGTSNGAIEVENVTGSFTAETSNGWIRAKAIRGTCKLRTSIGTIVAEDVHGGLEATGSIGDIQAEIRPSEGAEIKLRTGKGSIDVTLPADLRADLDLRTGNGIVQTMLGDVPLTVQLWSQNCVKAKMNGGGGAAVVARTSHGLITLKSR